MMPGSGAGENDTLPRMKFPSTMVLKVKTFVVDLLIMVVTIFSAREAYQTFADLWSG